MAEKLGPANAGGDVVILNEYKYNVLTYSYSISSIGQIVTIALGLLTVISLQAALILGAAFYMINKAVGYEYANNYFGRVLVNPHNGDGLAVIQNSENRIRGEMAKDRFVSAGILPADLKRTVSDHFPNFIDARWEGWNPVYSSVLSFHMLNPLPSARGVVAQQ